MIIYDYNLHIYIVYSMRIYIGLCSLKITLYNAIYIYTKFMKTIPDPRDDL